MTEDAERRKEIVPDRCSSSSSSSHNATRKTRTSGEINPRRQSRRDPARLAAVEVIQILHQPLLHFLARDDGVNQAVVQKELRRLKAWRQLGLRCVFDDARAG